MKQILTSNKALEQEIRWFGSVKARMEQKLLSVGTEFRFQL